MTGARGRVLSPGHASIQTSDAHAEALFGLVEQRQFSCLGQLFFDVPVLVEDDNSPAPLRVPTRPYWHPVAQVISEQFQPVMEPPLIEQPRLSVQELLDHTYDFGAHAEAPFPVLAPLRLSSTTAAGL